MSNSLFWIGSQDAGQIREKDSSRMALCQSIYKVEYNGFQISKSNNVVPRRKSLQHPRQSLDGIFMPKKGASNSRSLKFSGSCNNLKDHSDEVFMSVQESNFEGDKPSSWIKTAADKLQKDHLITLNVLKSRKSMIKSVQLKMGREGYDALLMWIIRSREDTLTIDFLPLLCKGLQKRRGDRTSISPMLALMLIPSILSLLCSRYEDYLSKALDYIEAFLCEILPPRCPLYDSCMQELHGLLAFLNSDSSKLLKCCHETCFKIQNCLQLVQQKMSV